MNSVNYMNRKGKLHKIELYVVDPNNEYCDVEYLLLDIENKLYNELNDDGLTISFTLRYIEQNDIE